MTPKLANSEEISTFETVMKGSSVLAGRGVGTEAFSTIDFKPCTPLVTVKTDTEAWKCFHPR